MTQNISIAASVNNSVVNSANNYKKFNLQEALKGKPVVTRDGKKAKVICETRGKILVHIKSNKASYMDMTIKMNLDGSRFSNLIHNLDLMMA